MKMRSSIDELIILFLDNGYSDDEILKIAQVNHELLNSKRKLKSIINDQLALSIYFKLDSVAWKLDVEISNEILPKA